MLERDRLAENLFKIGSLRTRIESLIMNNLIRLIQTLKSETYSLALNDSIDKYDTYQYHRPR